jgi:hypothetical protein
VPPRLDLVVDLAGSGDDRWPTLELATSRDHARVEVLEDLPHAPFGRLGVQNRVESGILHAQGEGRREHSGDPFALDEPLEPPIRVVRGAEVLDRLAGAGEIVELATLDRALDLQVDPAGLVLQPAVARALAAGRAGRLAGPVGVVLVHGRVPIIGISRRPTTNPAAQSRHAHTT